MTPGPREALLQKVIGYLVEHGVHDTSMRTLAAGVGTSNRMLNYHFGSPDDLLAAVVDAVSRTEVAAAHDFTRNVADPYDAGTMLWEQVAANAETFAPLFYELSAQAMYRRPAAEPLRDVLTGAWVEALRSGFRRITDDEAEADVLGRLALAVGRGVLFEMALTGDRATADRIVATFSDLVRAWFADRPGPADAAP